jgi:hypothetical protein
MWAETRSIEKRSLEVKDGTIKEIGGVRRDGALAAREIWAKSTGLQ